MAKKSKKFIVMISGGCLIGVFDMEGEEIGDYEIVDYDNQENGNCPVCQEEMRWDDKECKSCGFIPDEDNWLEAVKNTIRSNGEK